MNFMPREVYKNILGGQKGDMVHWYNYTIYSYGKPLKILISERGKFPYYIDIFGELHPQKECERNK